MPSAGLNPTESCATIASYIAATGKGDLARQRRVPDDLRLRHDPFILTLIFNAIAIRFVRKYRQVYE